MSNSFSHHKINLFFCLILILFTFSKNSIDINSNFIFILANLMLQEFRFNRATIENKLATIKEDIFIQDKMIPIAILKRRFNEKSKRRSFSLIQNHIKMNSRVGQLINKPKVKESSDFLKKNMVTTMKEDDNSPLNKIILTNIKAVNSSCNVEILLFIIVGIIFSLIGLKIFFEIVKFNLKLEKEKARKNAE